MNCEQIKNSNSSHKKPVSNLIGRASSAQKGLQKGTKHFQIVQISSKPGERASAKKRSQRGTEAVTSPTSACEVLKDKKNFDC